MEMLYFVPFLYRLHFSLNLRKIQKAGMTALVSTPILNRGIITVAVSVRVQICSRKIPGTLRLPAMTGYISNRTFKRRNSLFSSSALFM